ncbi:MAG TPA: hypothetical protein VFA74_13455 [Terriglobales bacterium]|nr:hypothetical protein [Terriglobales bacterium]
MREGTKARDKETIRVFVCLLAFGLLAFQYGDRNGLNDMPFAKVKAIGLSKAHSMAKQGNIDLLAGALVHGKEVSLRGELTDANCYLNTGDHAYDHAFCAKFCVAAGSPILFIADDGGKVYVVLTAKNGLPLPEAALNQLGIPGIMIKGQLLTAHGVDAIALESAGS